MTKMKMAKAVFGDSEYARQFVKKYPDAVKTVYKAYKEAGELI